MRVADMDMCWCEVEETGPWSGAARVNLAVLSSRVNSWVACIVFLPTETGGKDCGWQKAAMKMRNNQSDFITSG